VTIPTSIDATAASYSGPQGGGRIWLRPVGYGLLLGASIALLEFAYYYPLVSSPDKLGVLSLASSLLSWCGDSVLLALTVALFERWQAPQLLGARQLVLAVTIGSVAGVLAWQAFVLFVLRERFGIWVFRDHVGQPVNMTGAVLYQIWLMLLFGGLAAAVYVSRQQHARMLATLRAAELSRETSQRRLAEESLAALQARIDPEFVFETLTKLERLYEADPPGADRLLEELIVFLRAALGNVQDSAARTQGRDEAFQMK
jgi:hypothetical protein